MFYLALITIGLCVQYVGVYFLYPYLIKGKKVAWSQKQWVSVYKIICLSLLSYVVYYFLPDGQFENRVLHSLSGGFVSIYACYFAVKDLAVLHEFKVDKFQYVAISFLLVMFLGIVNEIAECFLQNVFGFIAADTINDTWFDLISNLVGAVVALLLTKSSVQKIQPR